MSYKEIDYGSYESPNSIVLGMVNEDIFCQSPNNPGSGYDDNELDPLD